ncbi:MAG TPA: NapC/NirT family cytochrome c, partial [Coriobacteriia bacterium]|nr:NapC/NirT family cytochrome c [Coriobacteriia bacterium]
MRFNPFGLFLNPRTRPRAIIWGGVLLIGFVIMWAAGLILTSTDWFCTTPCHIVHDDNTAAYHQSTHGKVSCIACHEPLAASPLTFTMMKIHVLPDLPATILRKFEMPVNDGSYVALEMPTEQCTQCHNLDNRDATPTQGILIDHKIHEQQGITCTTCHNRIAHPEEDITLVLEGNRKHDNWAKMDGCFRCHSPEKDAEAPGTCSSCHTEKFDLEPASHNEDGWYTEFGRSNGHARAAIEESASVAEALKLADERAKEHGEEAETEQMKPSSAVNSCFT